MRSEMPEKRKKYDREFREGAVRIVGRPGSRSRRSRGTSASTRAPWATGLPRTVRPARAVGSCPGRLEELKRLRAENAELRMERDVLKRSVVLWVKEATK